MEILDQVIVRQVGNMKRVRRYFQGIHPDRGIVVRGITGWETMEEIDVFVASHVYTVEGDNE